MGLESENISSKYVDHLDSKSEGTENSVMDASFDFLTGEESFDIVSDVLSESELVPFDWKPKSVVPLNNFDVFDDDFYEFEDFKSDVTTLEDNISLEPEFRYMKRYNKFLDGRDGIDFAPDRFRLTFFPEPAENGS